MVPEVALNLSDVTFTNFRPYRITCILQGWHFPKSYAISLLSVYSTASDNIASKGNLDMPVKFG